MVDFLIIARTKNATKGIFWGGLMKIYMMVVPFLMRTVMIYFMGVQYLGLNSLFTSILQVLNLAELGIGSAMVFSMYKPIAEDDKDQINALLKLYRKYYRIVGLIIGLVGILLTPFIPRLISGDVPADINIYVLYLLNLSATVLTYWLFAYKNSLLQAHQRVDVSSIITLISNTIQYSIQLFVLIVLKNYYLYVIAILISQVINNILTAMIVGKMYPDYKPIGEMNKNDVKGINNRIKDLFTGKLGAVIINSADTIVISAFLGLTVLAIYQNYFYLITAVTGFMEIVFSSMLAGLGNSYIIETKEKNYSDLEKFTFIFCWLFGFCFCCFLCLYQPFMEIWVGKENMLNFSAVICFSIYFYVYEINRLLNTFKDAAGLWHEDRFRPLITALTNLTLNLVTVQIWGIYGVLLSTVISVIVVGMPWILYNIFTVYFNRSLAKKYIMQLLRYTGIVIVVACITYCTGMLVHIGQWGNFFIRLIICLILPNVLFLLAYHKNSYFRLSIQLVDKMTKNKLHLEKRIYRL